MIVGVVGAGAMGRGIAQVSATAGHDVLLFDMNQAAVPAAISSIADSLARAVERGRATQTDKDAALARIRSIDSMEEFADCELVIEAVVERLDVKRSVFAQLDAVVAADAILASNTSSLSIASICSGIESRERMVGLHFFNPVPAMALVEIVASPFTSEPVMERAREFVDSIGKTGVVVLDSPGFLVNLAGRAYVTEALSILQEGVATVEQIDRIAKKNLGFALGPFELMDLTGLDVNYPVTANLFEHNFGDARLRSTWYHRYLHDAGLLGRKTGRGFYDYEVPNGQTTDTPATGVGTIRVAVAGRNYDLLVALCERASIPVVSDSEADLILVAPLGTDCSQTAQQLGIDPKRTVGIDLSVTDASVHTLMVGPGVSGDHVAALAARLATLADVEVIRDSPGFIAQRLLATIVNLAGEIAQRGIATPIDIDTAVKLGLRYPHGPLEWADAVGVDTITAILSGMHATTADQRYTTSAWLRRRASAGLSALTPDFT